MKRIFPLLLLSLLALAGCTSNQQDSAPETKYLPVQLVGSDKWSILDITTGEVVARDLYKNTPSAVVNDMFYVMNDKGLYYYYNVSDPKKPVNAEPFGSVTPFSDDGVAVASRRGGTLTVIDMQCQVVKELPGNIAECEMFNNGLAPYHTDMGLWGYIDVKGDTVIGAHYANVNAFLYTDKAVVVDAENQNDSVMQFSVINSKGDVLFSASTKEYGLIRPFFISGVLPAIKGDSIVCLDPNGKEVPNPNDNHQAVDDAKYDEFSRTSAGYFIVAKDGKMGLVDNKNTTLIEPKYTRLIDITAERYIAFEDTICHLVDRTGNAIGNAKFIHAHGSIESSRAARGFIDTSLAAANWLMLFDSQQCCGATPKTTLMDMNSLLGTDPSQYTAYHSLVAPQGPFRVEFFFDSQLATAAPADSTGASFNYGARVTSATIALNVRHCGLQTEKELVDKLSSALGTRGFIYKGDGIFTSEEGPAVTLGYDDGITTLYYFMNAGAAQAQKQQPRQ